MAATFDHTAQLAEEHARRLSDPQDDKIRDTEYAHARQAREAAQRARANARQLRDMPPERDPRSSATNPRSDSTSS